MQKINLDDLQQQISKRQLKEPEQRQTDGMPSKKLMFRLWEVMQEAYGHQWNSQYGEEPTETWGRLLTGISPDQIKDGLEKLKTREDTWPPNAQEFRQLCLPNTTSPDGKNAAAYIDFKDPKHPSNDPDNPEYCPKGLEDLTKKGKSRAKGRETLDSLKGMLK